MGLYHAINLSCVAYIKRYTVKVVIYPGGKEFNNTLGY